jgi:hypothetical protein
MRLTNQSGFDVRFPFDLSAAHWTGLEWQVMPCPGQSEATTDVGPLCGVINTNTNRLSAGTTASSDGATLSFFWPGETEIPPGTYALLVPIWRTSEEYPTELPGEAAVAIVAIVPGP